MRLYHGLEHMRPICAPNIVAPQRRPVCAPVSCPHKGDQSVRQYNGPTKGTSLCANIMAPQRRERPICAPISRPQKEWREQSMRQHHGPTMDTNFRASVIAPRKWRPIYAPVSWLWTHTKLTSQRASNTDCLEDGPISAPVFWLRTKETL